MRLYLTLSKNTTVVPFNNQHLLTGCMHKWLGENNKEHGEVKLVFVFMVNEYFYG